MKIILEDLINLPEDFADGSPIKKISVSDIVRSQNFEHNTHGLPPLLLLLAIVVFLPLDQGEISTISKNDQIVMIKSIY